MRKSYRLRRGDATRVLLSAALGFGASFVSSVVFPKSPTLRVFAADLCAALVDSESAVDRAVVERLNAQFR